MQLMSEGEASSYTGGYAVADQRVAALLRPLAGESHLLLARAGGAMRGYLAGFDGTGRVSIIRRDFGVTRLASRDFPWTPDRDYRLELSAIGDRLALSIDGHLVLDASDGSQPSGMVGCGALSASRALYGPFEVEELS